MVLNAIVVFRFEYDVIAVERCMNVAHMHILASVYDFEKQKFFRSINGIYSHAEILYYSRVKSRIFKHMTNKIIIIKWLCVDSRDGKLIVSSHTQYQLF